MSFYCFAPGNEGAPSRLLLDGEIVPGGWAWLGDVDASIFSRELMGCKDIDVIINSPGGDVFAGAMIYSLLKAHPYKVRVMIAGIAASAASVVAMAGDEVLISPAGYMMIHNPWMHAVGDAAAMEKAADQLREVAAGIVNAYRLKTGMEESALQALLEAETYMNANSAIELGFADGLWQPEESSVKAAPAARMAGRSHTPKAIMARMQGKKEPGCKNPEALEADSDAEKRRRMKMLALAAKIE